MIIQRASAKWFYEKILTWHKQFGRHDLPWKKSQDPYPVFISEIMLQQTQVSTVIPYFNQFMKIFPTIQKLATAPLDEVLHQWSGLGYYARARNLHKTANIIVDNYHGYFPESLTLLQKLPGIGRSTAGAILAQAFDQWGPILDANVKRVLCRFHRIQGWPGQKETEHALWDLAEYYTPKKHIAEYTQAIMDLGATCCTRTQPNCKMCPLQSKCQAFANTEALAYPHKKPRKKLVTKKLFMLFAKCNHKILLQQRELKGIWAGLWSFPEFKKEIELQAFLTEHFKLTNYKIQTLPLVKHTFSHFHLEITPRLVILNKTFPLSEQINVSWVTEKELTQRGLPAPIKKLIYEVLT